MPLCSMGQTRDGIADALQPLLASPETLRTARDQCRAHLLRHASDMAVLEALEQHVLGLAPRAKPVDLHPQSSNCEAI